MSGYSPEEFERLVPALTREEMLHYGYTDEEITKAENDPPHTDQCEYVANDYSWICDNGDGKSYHPAVDEYFTVAFMIGRILESPILAADRKAQRVEAYERGWDARHNYDERAGEAPPPNPYEEA